ncbi:uncharacterized protein ARMOST_00215 [Armillaria ostoyae]|uniref:Uncharacterized protein n=1 Tax=Armillaria ostoyae TaxID=47428 RepID=A0A284QKG2_ARMOS|nr:uncharacterized protein ARMOST_00215 [Armillaria ostoyae]
MPLFDSVVSHAAEWPTEIKDLACLLDSPIPSQLVNDPCPIVSSRASPLLEELRNSLTGSPEQLTNSDSEVLDILDLVLPTVGTLRALSDASNNGTKQSTISFWSLLIRSLAFVCYDKSYAMQEAAFVRPRLSYVQSSMEDGYASLLISHIVEDIQRPKSAEESDSETSYDDESSYETSYERTEASTDLTSARSSYVPLDAHILASWRHPYSAVLPFLCVTDEEDIFGLMGDVLYQRSTWGISEPVIGIILLDTGFVGRVVLGWLDKLCPDPEVLSAIRFAYGDETRTDASLGVYDLTDPVSAVKFAQFILGLRAHVEGIVAQCHTPSNDFRGDQIASMMTIRVPKNNGNKGSLIGLIRLQNTEHLPSSRQVIPAHPPWLTLKSAKRGRLQSQAEPSPQLRVRRPRLMERPSSLRNVAGKSGWRLTVLRGTGGRPVFQNWKDWLGAKSLAGISTTAKLSFSSYAHDHHITGLTDVQFKVNTKELEDSKMPASEIEELETIATEINEMLEFYEEMTQYMQPPIAKLCGSISVHKSTHPLLARTLGSFLKTSVGGYSKEKGGKDHNEAEARHEWDILLNLGFVNTKELASERVVLERALSLSHNVAADLAKSSALFDGKTFRAVADQGYEISRHVQQALNRLRRTPHFNSDLLLQAGDVKISLRYQAEVSKLFKDEGEAKHTVLKRNGDEPELGIIDAILTIPLEHSPKSLKSLVRITEIHETVQAARTLNAENIPEPDDKPVLEAEPPKANGHAKKPKTSRAESA